ncbi:helix-turn-helix domain-containing protein [Actinacidiphila glaucinigra]|uniref:helix-turn-helix domain-containing protein n=1 Tax=Actinacidiphila glaucinigra TaxID=235986 RepID=UPI0032451FD9
MTPTSAAPASGYLTTGQAAARIGSTPQHVRGLIRAGAIQAIDIAKGQIRPRFRIPVAAVDQYLAAATVTPTEEIA